MIAALVFEGSTAVSDGKHVLYGMLLTALFFLLIVAIGELTRWAGGRRKARKRDARAY